MTPRGSSTISDAVDIELQILATEREDITQLVCTKSRRTRNVVRKGWRRDFFYDDESLLITPIHEQSDEKQALVEKLKAIKELCNLTNVAMAEEIGTNERSIRRWLSGDSLPSELNIPKIAIFISNNDVDGIDAESTTNRREIDAVNEQVVEPVVESTTIDTPNDSSLIYSQTDKELKNISNKELKNKDVSGRNNVNKAKATKSKKSSKTSSTKKKSIDPTNPCSACPALKEKEARFVDGEGSGENGVVHI